ncbi:hypothetical protein Pcinc_030154 [Petrolisthes cinctipes]|uniref:C-type lectin domain-containing protein n=1 Tax=Petrolisthes cinctipes TaxID=88211 RepID=A0AAE1EYN4_PETCI|nr:hypothetical protein Pcinc_030154 [Petrolisthes cinctipes]
MNVNLSVLQSSPPSSSTTPSAPSVTILSEKCSNGSYVCASGYSKFNDQCYKVMKTNTPVDFTTAQRKCQGDGAVLAADKTPQVHNFLKGLLQPHLSETVDSQYRRAFIGLMCQNACDSPTNWLYADGSRCEGNSFCDWLSVGSTNEWNALPTSLYGASIAAMLDDFPDTSYRYKLQPYPSDHTLQYMICQKSADSTEHLKPRSLVVSERLSNVVLQWQRPACSGDVSTYILVLLGSTVSVSYDTEMKCTTNECSYTLNPEDCNYCIHPNTDYTFSVAAVLSDSQLGPAITVNKKIGYISTLPHYTFSTLHTTTLTIPSPPSTLPPSLYLLHPPHYHPHYTFSTLHTTHPDMPPPPSITPSLYLHPPHYHPHYTFSTLHTTTRPTSTTTTLQYHPHHTSTTTTTLHNTLPPPSITPTIFCTILFIIVYGANIISWDS